MGQDGHRRLPAVKELSMRTSRLFIALLAALVGGIWLGQGLGFIGGSFMTGSPFWAVVGVALLALAAVIVVVEVRRRPRT
jgi:F0F1-type ATP synthase assembly protein I